MSFGTNSFSFRRGLSKAVLLASTLLLSVQSHAFQSNAPFGLHEKAIERIDLASKISPVKIDGAFGDSFAAYHGSAGFSVTDVSIPGNSNLPVSVTRALSVDDRYRKNGMHIGGFGIWDIDLPKISGVFSTQSGWYNTRCTQPGAPNSIGNFQADSFWSGHSLSLPGGGEESLLMNPSSALPVPADGHTYPWVTKGLWRIRCKSSTKNGYPGEAFIALSPDGVKYHLDWVVSKDHASIQSQYSQYPLQRQAIHFLVSRVEDRFGNWVDYTYQGSNLVTILSNDGRRIDLNYTSSRVQSIVAHGRTWTYSYGGYNSQDLQQVTNPDGSTWTYTQTGQIAVNPPIYTLPHEDEIADCPDEVEPEFGQFSITVKAPSGANGKFDFEVMRHYRDLPNPLCFKESSTYEYLAVPRYSASLTLTKKTLTGAGLGSMVWDYGYDYDQNGRKVVTISRPGIEFQRLTFGVTFDVDEGQLFESSKGASATSILRVETNQYTSKALNPSLPFPACAGLQPFAYASKLSSACFAPLKSKAIAQDGTSFNLLVDTFDMLARPLQTTRSNTLGNARTDIVEYYDNLPHYVIGQVARSYNINAGSVIESETQFTSLAQPWRVYAFGRLKQTLGYNTDGTLSTVADGNQNIITLSSWKRGIPRSIVHPVTPEAPQGASESATVDDNGWITSVTDEIGAVTGYGYDAMGRLASIVQPTGDALAAPSSSGNYYNTLRNFRPLVAADWKPAGVADGQWRLYEEVGNRATVTYMDALWRPVLKHEYDAQNVAATLRASKTSYDTSGRVSFQSYPSSDTIPGNTGTRTFYDAIDRVIKVEQDSELGVLSTTTQYLSGFKTLVTNPKGFATTTSFMAWDAPSYDYPVLSEQPEGKVIQIVRHPQFGWPQQLTQRNAANTLSATRRYVYDGNAQLCKTIEPETGVTVMDYDGAGNLVWQASGLDGTSTAYNSTTDCQHAAAYGAGRTTTRTYDPRNRLTHLTFPDGLGNQIWTYEKDNLPKSVTAYNDAGNTAPVVTTYSYNNRRLLVGETLAQPNWYSWSVGYAYDGYGHLSTQTYPTGLVVDYAPNPLGQATKAGTYASGAQYYPNGALKQFTYGNGIVHTMTQNARQLPERTISSGGVLDYQNYYDANGNVEHIANNLGVGWDPRDRWMQYDQLDRLTAAGSGSFGGDHWHRMTYDALDNLKSWKLAGVKDYADYVYDAQNRLTSIRNTAGATVVGIAYDPQGNLQNKNGQTYTFDFGNRLRNVTDKESYRYDGLGRRVTTWKLNNAAELWMYSQAGQMLFSSTWEGSGYLNHKTHQHVYLAGSLVASIDRAWPSNTVLATKYQHTDALGSPVAVTNESGQVIERMDYEPWGAIIGKPNHNGIGYTGHVMDGTTGLTYMQQRYYDQSVGRFLSVDPVVADSGSGVNFNRYKYANNNPYVFTDPDGRLDFKTLGSSIKGEVAGALGVKVKISIGPIKIELGTPELALGVGGTADGDAYGFSETNGASASIKIGEFKAGYFPERTRTDMGKADVAVAERHESGGWSFGFSRDEVKVEAKDRIDGPNEVGASFTVGVLKGTAAVDADKLVDGVLGDGESYNPDPKLQNPQK